VIDKEVKVANRLAISLSLERVKVRTIRTRSKDSKNRVEDKDNSRSINDITKNSKNG
jgi:hypothetical protein